VNAGVLMAHLDYVPPNFAHLISPPEDALIGQFDCPGVHKDGDGAEWVSELRHVRVRPRIRPVTGIRASTPERIRRWNEFCISVRVVVHLGWKGATQGDRSTAHLGVATWVAAPKLWRYSSKAIARLPPALSPATTICFAGMCKSLRR